jgi:hypothetical protein
VEIGAIPRAGISRIAEARGSPATAADRPIGHRITDTHNPQGGWRCLVAVHDVGAR